MGKKEKTTFKSVENGLRFDCENQTSASLLSSHNKSQFIKAEDEIKGKKTKIVIGESDEKNGDNEQEIS